MTLTRYHVIKLLVLTLLQIHVSLQQGIFKFINIKEERKTYNLRSGRCCGAKNIGFDIVNSCHVPCQIVFSICLISLGDNDKICMTKIETKKPITSQIKQMDVKFSAIYDKPLSMELTAKDLNSKSDDDVIFEASYNHPLTFTDRHWNHVTSSSTNHLLTFSYKLGCKKYLYGPSCNILCIPRNDNAGHYNCAYNGERICYPDWYGDYCDEMCDCDNSGEKRGTCRKNGTCVCNFGWTGKYCNKDLELCVTNPCRNGGICNTKTGVCLCPTSSTGRYCEHLIIAPSSTTFITTTTTIVSSLYSQSQTLQIIMNSSIVHNKSISISSSVSSKFLSTSLLSRLTSQKTLSKSMEFSTFSTNILSSSSKYSQQSSSINSEEIQPSRTVSIDVSKLIASTVWLPMTRPTEETNTSTTVPSKSTPTSSNVISITSITISVILFLAGISFWFLWRRKREYRRKSQASTIVPITLNSSESSDNSRPSTFSSSRSISPLMNYLYEKDNISDLEPPDIEVISVLDKPVGQGTAGMVNYQEDKSKCYTLKEVDKICMEVFNGTTATTKHKKPPKQKRTSRRVRVSKTLSNGSSKSQQSSNYSSSGYGSGSSSPALNQSCSTTSLIGRRSTDKGLDHFTVRKNESQIDNNNRTPSSKSRSRDQNVVEEDDFYHNTIRKVQEKSEGLPNFISYLEDTKI